MVVLAVKDFVCDSVKQDYAFRVSGNFNKIVCFYDDDNDDINIKINCLLCINTPYYTTILWRYVTPH